MKLKKDLNAKAFKDIVQTDNEDKDEKMAKLAARMQEKFLSDEEEIRKGHKRVRNVYILIYLPRSLYLVGFLQKKEMFKTLTIPNCPKFSNVRFRKFERCAYPNNRCLSIGPAYQSFQRPNISIFCFAHRLETDNSEFLYCPCNCISPYGV